MSGKKTGNRILTAVIVLLVLILSLGLLSRLFGGFIGRPEITLTYAGEGYKKSVSGLKIEPESQFGIKLRDKNAGYDVKIYAQGTEETDFTFTVDGTAYSWYESIASANQGKGEDFTEVFEVEKTETGFTFSGGIEKALRDVWPDAEIALPANIPAGDRFRMEITSGKSTLKLGFCIKDTGSVGVQGVEISPGEIVF